jgi:hypothetical protein
MRLLQRGGLLMKSPKNKVRRDLVKFEICHYPKTKREIEHWQALTTTTAVIDYKCKIVEAIEEALKYLEKDGESGLYKEKLLTNYFWGNADLTLDGLALKQYVHRNTAKKWINEFINEVGANLGLFDYDR